MYDIDMSDFTNKPSFEISLPKSEIDKMTKDLVQYESKVTQRVMNEIVGGSFEVLSDAKQPPRMRVKTGRLRSSGLAKFNNKKLTGEISFNTNYAAKIEDMFGFLVWGYNKNIEKIINNIKKILDKP